MTQPGFGLPLVGVLLSCAVVADAWPGPPPGSLVAVEIWVEGRQAPLYSAADGSGRWYLEAREGARYSIRLQNRTAQRLGVALSVDGLNVISGDRTATPVRPGDPGRLYVLEPGDVTEVRGWRASLREVQRFVFVDEQASYAARAGKANARMGWIEMAVYRERYPVWPRVSGAPSAEEGDAGRGPESQAGAPKRDRAEPGREGGARQAPPSLEAPAPSARPSYPGTGWGPRADDRAELVAFDPHPHPAEQLTLRYEYREALIALGIDPRSWPPHDRLWQREQGREGFARPPAR
jgi:hypothetical protein